MSYDNIIKYNQPFNIDLSFNEINNLNNPIGDSFFIQNTNLENVTVCMSGNIVSLKKDISNDILIAVPEVFPQTSATESSKAKSLIYVDSSSNNIKDSKIIYINNDRKDVIQTAPFFIQTGGSTDQSGYRYLSLFDISLNQFKVDYSTNPIDYDLNALLQLYIDDRYVIYNDTNLRRILISSDYRSSTKRIFVYETYAPATRNNLSAIVINDSIYLSYMWDNRLNIKKAVFTNTQVQPFFITTTIINNYNSGQDNITFTKILFTDEEITFLLGYTPNTLTDLKIYMIFNNKHYYIDIKTNFITQKSTSILQSNIRDCLVYRNVEIDKINCLTLIALTNTGAISRTFDYVALKNSIYNGNLNDYVVLTETNYILISNNFKNPVIDFNNEGIFYNEQLFGGNPAIKYQDMILSNNKSISFTINDTDLYTNLKITSASNKYITTHYQNNTTYNFSYQKEITNDNKIFDRLIDGELDLFSDASRNLYRYITSDVKYNYVNDNLNKNNFIYNDVILVDSLSNVNSNTDYTDSINFKYYLKNNNNFVFIGCLFVDYTASNPIVLKNIKIIPYIIKDFLNNTIYDGETSTIFYNENDDNIYIAYVDANPANFNNKMLAIVNLNKNTRSVSRQFFPTLPSGSTGISYESIFQDSDVEFNTATLIPIINISANKNINYYTSNLVHDEYIKKILYCNDLLYIFLTNLGRLMYLYSDNRNGSYAKLHKPSSESFTLYEIPYSYSNNNRLIIDNINIASDASATYDNENKQIIITLVNRTGYVRILFNDQSQPCFLSISKVLTINSNGEEEYKTIDTIKAGDIVKSPSGKHSKVKHCGYTPAFTMMDELDYPRIIPKDYFGEGLPTEQIYGSGWHAIYLPKDKSYSENIQKAIKISKSMLAIQNESESKLYHKVYLFTITDLCLIKTIKEIQELTGKATAHYYNMELENPTEGFIVSGLPVESLSKDLWDEFRFTDNH